MPPEDFEEFRGQLLFAIGETEILVTQLNRGTARDEIKELRLQSLWQDIVKSLRRYSKHYELPKRSMEFLDVFDRLGLDDDDFVALCESYIEEIREVANREGFSLGVTDA